ncbi:hypothetical protein NMYAN_20339 [Nitrosomonas nitrosa]|uniref:Uncharacterized protein n=1 Tax=Nitrosomonas nitrosa TaxID=52442 RepID=A0A8H9DBC4_9PROT|nr:hypothetical protein NMYAN_20339 [Nitrosomonas nitrosa]
MPISIHFHANSVEPDLAHSKAIILSSTPPVFLFNPNRKTGVFLLKSDFICDRFGSNKLQTGLHNDAGNHNTTCPLINIIYTSHFKIRHVYLLPLGEDWMRGGKNRILRCGESSSQQSPQNRQLLFHSNGFKRQ